jgi:hypothetical protein
LYKTAASRPVSSPVLRSHEAHILSSWQPLSRSARRKQRKLQKMKLRSLQMRPHVTIKQLPQELMSAILVFLPRKDILSFSLACRYTERAAVRELYHTQGFRQSQQSVNQLIEFSKDAPRAQLVRTLVWDTDLWFLEANALDLELWLENVPVEHAVNAYRKYYGVKEVPPYQLAQIAKAGEEWFFHYQKNVMDEIIARNLLLWHFMFDSFLTNLPKLNKIYLLNGQFSFPLYNRIEYLCPTVPELRTYEYLPRGADRFNDSSPALGIGVRAFFDIIKGIYYWQVDRCRKGLGRNNNLKLRIKTLDYSAFTLGRSSIDQIEPCPEFSSLHIQITSERQGYMGRPDMNLSDQTSSVIFQTLSHYLSHSNGPGILVSQGHISTGSSRIPQKRHFRGSENSNWRTWTGLKKSLYGSSRTMPRHCGPYNFTQFVCALGRLRLAPTRIV